MTRLRTMYRASADTSFRGSKISTGASESCASGSLVFGSSKLSSQVRTVISLLLFVPQLCIGMWRRFLSGLTQAAHQFFFALALIAVVSGKAGSEFVKSLRIVIDFAKGQLHANSRQKIRPIGMLKSRVATLNDCSAAAFCTGLQA